MTDDVLFTAPAMAPAGMYPATVTAVELVTVETAEGPKRLVRWSVAVEVAPGEYAEPDALSSLLFSPKSKARRWAVALGIPADQKELRPSDLVGRECMALIVDKDGGNTGLGDILPPVKGKAK